MSDPLDATPPRGWEDAAPPAVVLVTTPWAFLELPSLSLGIIKGLLKEAGIASVTRSANLAFMEHLVRSTEALPEAERLTLADFQAVSDVGPKSGLGDWIFAVPPFRTPSAADDAVYLTYLRANRVEAPLVDKALRMRALVPAFLEEYAARLLAGAPKVVGFTSSFSQNVPSLVLARCLKEREPHLRIVFGGANCDGPMGPALCRAFPWVDVVVQGEGEPVVVELMRELLRGGRVTPRPGLAVRQDGEVTVREAGARPAELEHAPLPDFDDYFSELERSPLAPELVPRVVLPFETSRGCWWGQKHHCTFCGVNGSTMVFRGKSADRAYTELIELARRYRRLDFAAADNIIDYKYMRELLPRLRDAGIDLSIFYETKANLKKAEVRLLREAGILRIQPGLESLSSPILALMKKGVTAWQNIRLLKWCMQYGVEVVWNIIFGFPGEPPGEYARMAALVPALVHLMPPSLSRLHVERFSPYHERPQDFGLVLRGPRPHYRLLYPMAGGELEALSYDFDFSYADGRDPMDYVVDFMDRVEAWRERFPRAQGTLSYRRGPDFVRIVDQRPGIADGASFLLEGAEAVLFLACEDGATLPELLRALEQRGPGRHGADEVRGFLDELVEARLLYEEGGRYLSLAMPELPRLDAASQELGPQRSSSAHSPPKPATPSVSQAT